MQQVVALDVGHRDGHSEFVGQRPYRLGQAGRVESAGIGDDAHAAVLGQTQTLLHLNKEGLGITAVRTLHPVSTEDQHGQLGQIVAGQIVQLTADEHLAHRGKTIAVEP